MDDLIPFRQDVIEEETSKEPQADNGMNQLIIFDPCDFQKTILGTFLFSPFVGNKNRVVELSRHELGMQHVVFEPGGKVWHHRNNTKLIGKDAAEETFDFGVLLSSGEKLLHRSARKEFKYEIKWRMKSSQSWIQQTSNHRKSPSDLQDITNLAEHVGLDHFGKKCISDWAGRLQTYLWRPGAYFSILIIHGEHSTRARISWGHKQWEGGRITFILDHNKLRKPPDCQGKFLIESKLDKDHPIDRGKWNLRSKRFQKAYEHAALGSSHELTSKGYEFHYIVLKVSNSSLMHLFCPISAQKGTRTVGRHKKRTDGALEIKEKPPDELSLQQTSKQSTRGQTVLRSKVFEKKDSSYEPTCPIFLVLSTSKRHQFEAETNSELQDTDSTTQVILHLLYLKLFEFETTENYIWRPGEPVKVSNYVFKGSFITEYTDIMHLFLSKEPSKDFRKALEHKRRCCQQEDAKRFKPPDLDQDKHQDVNCFILIKETPPDATYKPKPSRRGFGLFLLLYDEFSCANLLCEYESGLINASRERRTKQISPFYITQQIRNHAYQRGLQGKCNLNSKFNVADLVLFIAGKTDLRTNLFEEGGDDMIMERKHEPEIEQLVAEDATRGMLNSVWKQEECNGRTLIILDTLSIIHTSPSQKIINQLGK